MQATRGEAPELAPLLDRAPDADPGRGNTPSGGVRRRVALISAAGLCGVLGLAAATRAGVVTDALLGLSSGEAAARKAALGRSGNRVLLSPGHHLAYCNIPKAASSTLTTYMTGLNAGIDTFSAVEKYIQDNGGDSHFALTQYSTFEEAEQMRRLNPDDDPTRYFTVVRHPGTRLYSTWFDKIHAHRGSDQPDLLWYGCDNDENCSFEKFVDGITAQVSTEDSREYVNEHVEEQHRLCDPNTRRFDGVFKIEDGFDAIESKLESWTGHRFDFKSEDGEEGYSHHNRRSKKVYAEFPVSDVEGYEALMPYDVQKKIYDAYRDDFELFGYNPPVRAQTQLDACPKIKWSEDLLDSEWHGEDTQHLDELEQQGIVDLDQSDDAPRGDETGKVRDDVEKMEEKIEDDTRREETFETDDARPELSSSEEDASSVEETAVVLPSGSAFGGNELIDPSEAATLTKRAKPAVSQEERDYAAKKALMAEAARKKTAEEEEEWNKEVEEARRLHDEEGLSAADAVAKARREAIWLRGEKARKEHEARVAELDARFEAAEKKEKERLMTQEDMTEAEAAKKARSEAKWLRDREMEKLALTEAMLAEESRKKDLSRASPDGDADGDGDGDAISAQEAEVGEQEADYADHQAERAAVEAQWAKPEPEISAVEAEYKQWMVANGKAILESALTRTDDQASNTGEPVDTDADSDSDSSRASHDDSYDDSYDDASLDRTRREAKTAFEAWKRANNIDGPGLGPGTDALAAHRALGGDGDDADANADANGGDNSFRQSVSDTSSDPAFADARDRVDPTEAEDEAARAARMKDLELSSPDDEKKLATFEAWKRRVERKNGDYAETDAVDDDTPIISKDGRVQTPEQARREAEEDLKKADEEEEMRAWVESQWGAAAAAGRGGAAAALGQSAAPGHALDFLRDVQEFKEMRAKVQSNHELLASELDAIRVDRPDIYAVIQANMEEFKALMMEGYKPDVEAETDGPIPSADEVFAYMGSADGSAAR